MTIPTTEEATRTAEYAAKYFNYAMGAIVEYDLKATVAQIIAHAPAGGILTSAYPTYQDSAENDPRTGGTEPPVHIDYMTANEHGEGDETLLCLDARVVLVRHPAGMNSLSHGGGK